MILFSFSLPKATEHYRLRYGSVTVRTVSDADLLDSREFIIAGQGMTNCKPRKSNFKLSTEFDFVVLDQRLASLDKHLQT